MATLFIREDMAIITVHVNGIMYGETWKEAEGGNLEADVAKARPGGMGFEKSAGGPASRTDLTVRTHLTDLTVLWHPVLEGEVGVGDATVVFHWLNRRRVALGTTTLRRGVLQAVNLPNMGAGSDAGLLEIVIDCDQLAL